ncbi:hypothetical protein SUN_0479 [Sulfurovum sp. NBC37-1]|nr:hypothetical protein SUN_0479 [Sulfurovum sp. NBC37-1]
MILPESIIMSSLPMQMKACLLRMLLGFIASVEIQARTGSKNLKMVSISIIFLHQILSPMHFYFQIGVLAYNLFILFKQILQNSWQKHTVATIRYKFYRLAGKVVKHSRQTILKVQKEFVEIFHSIRECIYRVSLE